MDTNHALNLLRSESGNTLYSISGMVSAAKNCDFDYLYHADEFELVNEALREIGFEQLSSLFFDEKIDFGLYEKLDRIDIYDILKSYPVGVKRTFYEKYMEWISSRQKPVSAIKAKNMQITVSLSEILKTEPGKVFKQSISEDNALSIKGQRALSGLIVDYYIKKNISFSREDMSRLSQEIKQFFTYEDPEVFYFDGQQPKGLLYHKYTNKLSSLNASTSKVKKRKISEGSPEREEISFTDEVKMSDDFIRANSQLPLGNLIEHWRLTSKYRSYKIKSEKQSVSQIIANYKSLQRADAYMLIASDFKNIYSSIDFSSKFDEISLKLLTVIKSNTVNPMIQQRLSNINNQSQSEKLLNVLFGLHYIFYDGGRQKGIKTKLSVNDTFKYLLLLAKTEHTYQSDVDDFKKHLSDSNTTLQPLIVGFGTSINDLALDKFFVICDELSYKFDNLVNAFESLMQIFFVFDLRFPTPNEKVFKFISALFYNLNNIKCDAKSNQLIKQINQ